MDLDLVDVKRRTENGKLAIKKQQEELIINYFTKAANSGEYFTNIPSFYLDDKLKNELLEKGFKVELKQENAQYEGDLYKEFYKVSWS